MFDYVANPANGEWISQAVKIQLAELPEGFLSSLGPEPLSAVFEFASVSKSGLLVVALEKQQTQSVVGYAIATKNINKFYLEFLAKRGLTALRVFLPRLLSWAKVKAAFETLIYPLRESSNKESLPAASLLDIAVTSDRHGAGVGEELFAQVVSHFRSSGVSEFAIPSSAGLDRAHAFYRKLGAVEHGSVEVHDGEPAVMFRYTIVE